jgi:Flp pilus assembly protein TadD
MKSPQNVTPITAVVESADAAILRMMFWVGAGLSFIVSLVVYAWTMEASSSFWDSGEFIATAYTLGIPHSPGTPLYVLVAKVASMLPLPFFSIAQRVNFLSAFCGAGGVLFLYVLAIRFFDDMMGPCRDRWDGLVRVAGAVAAAGFIMFSDTYWTNATEAEVYGMSNLFMGFIMWLAIKWGDLPKTPRSTWLIYLIFYLIALSVGFHLGTVLVFSGIFCFVLMSKERTFSTFDWLLASGVVALFIADATIWRNGGLTVALLVGLCAVIAWRYSRGSQFSAVVLGLFLLGLSVHLALLIRSIHNPNIDEGDPQNWRALYAVLRREQYPPTSMFERKASWGFQFQMFNTYFQEQFQMFKSYVGHLNLGSMIPIGLGIWGMVDQFVKHRKTFVMLFVTMMVLTVGLIIFLNFSDSEVRERDYFYSSGFYYFAVYIAIGAMSVLTEIRNAMAKRGAMAPVTAGACALMLAFPLFTMHTHWFTHNRGRNVTCTEYAHNMLVCLDKDAIIFTNGDNDTFPLWYVQEVEHYRTDVRVVNLSLLNTTWYIEQCRDNTPKVPITWTNEEIDRLQPLPSKDGWVLVADLAVDHILRTNLFKRPVYFAVTIPPSKFAPYKDIIEMEGLAYKVVPRRGENMINVPGVENCITKEFKYDCILTSDWTRDTTIYLAPFIEHLIQNYSAAFVQLAYAKHEEKDYQSALKYMKVAEEISPQLEPPVQLLGYYYLDAGDTAAAVNHYINALKQTPNDPSLQYRLAAVYEQMGKYSQALDLIDPIYRSEPDAKDLSAMVFELAARAGQVERARAYMHDWLKRHPDDTDGKKALEDFERQLAAAQAGQKAGTKK